MNLRIKWIPLTKEQPVSNIELFELPVGWTWTQLKDICTKPQYGWTTKADRKDKKHFQGLAQSSTYRQDQC